MIAPRNGVSRVELVVGDEAWCLVTEPVGKRGTRWDLLGVARVRIVELRDDRYRVVLLLASGYRIGVGMQHTASRKDLYVCRDRAEHRGFGETVERLYGPQRKWWLDSAPTREPDIDAFSTCKTSSRGE